MERAMKVQDVMLQAMAKKITWWQAAEILGISDRHMRRWRERYVAEGYNGLLDRRPLPGMLLHIDGSRHQWFQDERWYDLIVHTSGIPGWSHTINDSHNLRPRDGDHRRQSVHEMWRASSSSRHILWSVWCQDLVRRFL